MCYVNVFTANACRFVSQVIVCLLISHGSQIHNETAGPSLRDGAPSTADGFAEVLRFEPASGPLAGGTAMTIRLSYHPTMREANATTVTVAGRECWRSAVSAHGSRLGGVTVTCTVVPRTRGCGDGQLAGPVQITFDTPGGTKLTVTSSTETFRFVGDATADRDRTAGESAPELCYGSTPRFQGIASGGTALPLRGVRLSRLTNVTVHVHRSDGTVRRAACPVLDDTRMVCRWPALRGRDEPALRFGVLAVDTVTGRALDLSPAPNASGVYHLYPDPVLVDFETFGGRRAVAVYGRGLCRGYGIDDVEVRFRGHGGRCDVTSVATDRIVCRSTWPGSLAGLRDVVVTVGAAFERNVTRRSPPGALFRREAVIVAVTGSFLLLCGVSLLFAFRHRSNEQFDFARLDDSATNA